MTVAGPQKKTNLLASGAKVVAVCYFEKEHDFWVSKHIKKHKSTVLSIDWHPSNLLVATGSSDFRARIFSAALKDVDGKPQNPVLGFGADKLAFGELLIELDICGGWVHCVRWSPSGNRLACVGHDSTVIFADVSSGEANAKKVKHSGLPFYCCAFTNEDTLVTAGWDCAPYLYKASGGNWAAGTKMDGPGAGGASATSPRGAAAPPAPGAKGATAAAFSTFANKVDRGEDVSGGTTLTTKHQNAITQVTVYDGGKICTSGIDGILCFWKKP